MKMMINNVYAALSGRPLTFGKPLRLHVTSAKRTATNLSKKEFSMLEVPQQYSGVYVRLLPFNWELGLVYRYSHS